MKNIYENMKEMGYRFCEVSDDRLLVYAGNNVSCITKNDSDININGVKYNTAGFLHWMENNRPMTEEEAMETLMAEVGCVELEILNNENTNANTCKFAEAAHLAIELLQKQKKQNSKIPEEELKKMNGKMVHCVDLKTNHVLGYGTVFTDGHGYLYVKIPIATSRYIVKHINEYSDTWIAFHSKSAAEHHIKQKSVINN